MRGVSAKIVFFFRGAGGRESSAGTHWLSVGKDTGGRTSGVVVTAGAKVTGGRTGNVVGMLAPGLPVDVPAALDERRGQSLANGVAQHLLEDGSQLMAHTRDWSHLVEVHKRTTGLSVCRRDGRD